MKTPPKTKKYTVTWLSNHREKILRKRLNFIAAQTNAILKMLNQNRSPSHILAQLFAVKGGAQKLADQIFFDLLRQEIAYRTRYSSFSPETITLIGKSLQNCPLNQLPELLLFIISEEQNSPLR